MEPDLAGIQERNAVAARAEVRRITGLLGDWVTG